MEHLPDLVVEPFLNPVVLAAALAISALFLSGAAAMLIDLLNGTAHTGVARRRVVERTRQPKAALRTAFEVPPSELPARNPPAMSSGKRAPTYMRTRPVAPAITSARFLMGPGSVATSARGWSTPPHDRRGTRVPSEGFLESPHR